ncbi:hypothetical protein QA634_28075 [Methylobacterium sp. CB376]|uniref:hypothetical protein n=1 Tax=unclassified Methylobacterium TaxID=2615210 RepID=UPI002240395C|nr:MULTISPECIES: hypothetical protein [Methylobacterium]WFT79059.1 hypothetical protein QA634_28075 [Methylobacterium nodulans]
MNMDNHITGVELIDAQDNVEAMFKARAFTANSAVVIWDRARRVIRLRQRFGRVNTSAI